MKKNLSTVARAYGTAIKGGFNKAISRNKPTKSNGKWGSKPWNQGSLKAKNFVRSKGPWPKRDPQIRARGGKLRGLRSTLPSSDWGISYKG